ncbi:hypothetical protein Tco_0700056, partial [Tanacetum coccineum]
EPLPLLPKLSGAEPADPAQTIP